MSLSILLDCKLENMSFEFLITRRGSRKLVAEVSQSALIELMVIQI